MKKFKTISITILITWVFYILISIAVNWCFELFIGNNPNIFRQLNNLGNFFLAIVYGVSALMFTAFFIILIPFISYGIVIKDYERIKVLKNFALPSIIIIGSLALLSIAGVQLRGLNKVEKPKSSINSQEKEIILDYYYFNDSINDWVKINRMEYDAKISKNSKSILTYTCERLGYKRYHNNDSYKFIANKPKLKYFLFTEQNEKEITKDEFILYRKRDSLIRYE